MKRNLSLAVVIAAMAFCAQMVFAQQIEMTPKNFGGPVSCYDKVNILGSKLTIDGTAVTATAANLNSGVASSTASLVSNAVLKVYGSNLVIVTGGTVSVPASSIGSAALAFGTPYTTQTVAGVFTNVLDAKGLMVSHNP